MGQSEPILDIHKFVAAAKRSSNVCHVMKQPKLDKEMGNEKEKRKGKSMRERERETLTQNIAFSVTS
jgi:hypothetical protein